MHNTWPLSSLYDKHLSRCPCICPSLFVSVQINVKVQNTDITARPTGLEETSVPVHISQCLSLPENGFGGYVCCSFLWHMGLTRLKLIRTSGPSNEHNEGKPAKTASWLPQALWVQQQPGGRAEQVHVTDANREKGAASCGSPAGSHS